jgi:DNA polymerase
MTHVNVDIETFSSIDLKKAGLYKYVESPDFSILLIAYSIDGGSVAQVDLTENDIASASRSTFLSWLNSPDVILHAYNASFEWCCLCRWMDQIGWPHNARELLRRFRCTMVHALYCGYTIGLGPTGEALGLPQDKRKMGIGMSLIKTFCVPCTPTRSNGNRTRTLPHHEPEKWDLFKEYNRQDVVTEMEIEKRLSAFPAPESEQKLWELDQIINARGVRVDTKLIESALAIDHITQVKLTAEAVRISGLENPKSVQQLLAWLEEELDDEVTDLKKETVKDLLKGDVNSDAARRMLEIRQELSKTSTKKYVAMKTAVCRDERVRGLLQFYGANRTGRWAGRLVQVQNLPKNYLQTLEHARECVINSKFSVLCVIYGNVPDTLSQLIRTAFIPSEGNIFLVADFSAIEARVLAWLAGEQWVMDVFASHGKIYEATASQMFGVPIELIAKGNPEYSLRQKGKVATLALGYQGASGALIAMGALKMGLTETELPEIVDRWRQANKRIVDLWYSVENAALTTMRTGQPTGVRGLVFTREGDYANGQDFLTVALPSGRKLFYVRPFLTQNQWGADSIRYYGMDQKTKKWGTVDTYGGKLVENIVQAIARDCLAVSILRLESVGYPIVMHVHDEVILDVSEGSSLEDACGIMGQPIEWAPGLLLRADGFVTEFYKKD